MLIQSLKKLWHLVILLVTPRSRAEFVTRLKYREAHYQGATYTRLDRFPRLFAQAALLLKPINNPKIISFGCSTGEEVFTLAKYIPHAQITGVDINKWCLARAEKQNTNKNLSFIHRNSTAYDELSDIDAIFCLAVFQRTENRVNEIKEITEGLTFEKFEKELLILDEKLKVGGFLFIDHSDFSFHDTRIACNYIAHEFDGSKRHRERPLFGKDNILIAENYILPRVFIKQKHRLD
jgi:trans-aconitate methyltransferase